MLRGRHPCQKKRILLLQNVLRLVMVRDVILQLAFSRVPNRVARKTKKFSGVKERDAGFRDMEDILVHADRCLSCVASD